MTIGELRHRLFYIDDQGEEILNIVKINDGEFDYMIYTENYVYYISKDKITKDENRVL